MNKDEKTARKDGHNFWAGINKGEISSLIAVHRAGRAEGEPEGITHGPWSGIEIEDNHGETVGVNILKGNYVIAKVPNEEISSCYAPGWEANARLIAAAPDLLEACERVREQLLEQGFVNVHEGARLEAAIRKAKGE